MIKSNYNNDYNFGKMKEADGLSKIQKYFNDMTIEQTKERFHPYDFIGKDKIFDMKARQVNHNTYSTTIVKWYKCINEYPDKEFYFLFYFLDGLYYIKFDEDKFKTFEIKNFVRDKREGITDEPVLHVFIPIKLLTKID
jgi:hypothetical protein